MPSIRQNPPVRGAVAVVGHGPCLIAQTMQFAARTPLLLAALSALAVSVVGCAQKRSQPVARSAAPTVTAPPAAPSADETQADNAKRPRLGEASVYVDGKTVGVLRILELPSSVKARHIKVGRQGEYEVTQWSFKEYAKSVGIDPAKVKGVHFYGGSRIAVVEGAEFQRIGDKLTFSFSQGDRGKPRVHWPSEPFKASTTIDMVSAVTFYVDKTPPRLDENYDLVMPDGSKVAGKVPYADNEQGNGTRVYRDGALVGFVKRKKLTNDIALTAPDAEGPTKFSLGDYAGKLGADAKNVKAIDLVAGDDVIAHVEPGSAKTVAFHVPARNQGQILVDVPVGQTEKRAARVSAVQIFVKTTPPARTITSLDDAPAAAPAGNGGGNGGGKSEEDE